MAAPRLFRSSLCVTCRQRLLPLPTRRAFSAGSVQREEKRDDTLASLNNVAQGSRSRSRNTFHGGNRRDDPFGGQSLSSILDAPTDSFLTPELARNFGVASSVDQTHRFHVYATKHNTHITFVQPPRPASQTASSGISGTSASAADQKKTIDVLLSLSTGNIGFRKAGRGSYDAAYQLTAFVLKQIQEKGMLRDVQQLEVVLRGFGAGREAVTKALLGSEGRYIRHRITSVVDATRLKQGGPRSKKPRRLG